MREILFQVGLLVAVIALGYVLKRTGVLPKEAFGVVSKTVLWVTLPSVVICNFAKTDMDPAYLWMIVIGFGTMALLAWIGYWINRKKSVNDQVFDMIKELHAGGTTILLVEQNASKALEIADRAYVLETGSITLSGTGAELVQSDEVRKAYLGG